jgi:predicted nucleic acid-binding protein
VQVLGETFRVLTGKGKLPVSEAHAIVMKWRNLLAIVATTNELMLSALELAADHKIYIWDALVLAAAAEARCDLLLSEDFQDGFAWRGVTVVNPFAEKPHKMLAKLLRG